MNNGYFSKKKNKKISCLFRWLKMDEQNLFDQVYELGEVISSGPHSELRRCRRIGKSLELQKRLKNSINNLDFKISSFS